MRTFAYIIIALALATLAACEGRGRAGQADDAYALLEEVATRNAQGHKLAALRLADSALALSPADTTRCWLLSEKAVALTDLGRMGEALAAGREALGVAEAMGDVDATLNMRGALGIAYRRMGRADSALAEYEKGIALAVREKNREYELYLDNCVAVLYSEEGRYAEALAYAAKAERAAWEGGDTVEALSARANVGGIHVRQKRYAEALSAVLPSWQGMVEGMGVPALSLKYLSVMLKAYAALDRREELRTYMAKADGIVGEVGGPSAGVLGILEIKADMLGRQGRHEAQLALLDTLSALSATNRAMPEERLLGEKARCLYRLGRTADAFRAMQEAYAMLDSVKQGDLERSMSEFTVKYATLEKERSLEQVKREKLALENRALWLAVAVALLLAVVGVMAHRRKLAAQRAELARRRSYISGLEAERERLAKELHDGICNDILATTLLLATDGERAARQLADVWKDVRHLSHALMPPRFKDTTLAEAVGAYVATLRNDDGCRVELAVDDRFDWRRLSERQAYETYRIVQEATSNALRHGQSASLEISLQAEGGAVVATIANEAAAEAPPPSTGIGEQTMRKRAEAIKARLDILTEGTRHIVRLKYDGIA